MIGRVGEGGRKQNKTNKKLNAVFSRENKNKTIKNKRIGERFPAHTRRTKVEKQKWRTKNKRTANNNKQTKTKTFLHVRLGFGRWGTFSFGRSGVSRAVISPILLQLLKKKSHSLSHTLLLLLSNKVEATLTNTNKQNSISLSSWLFNPLFTNTHSK